VDAIDWPIAAAVWGFALLFVGFHFLSLMRNRQLVEFEAGDADLITTTQGDLLRLGLLAMSGVLILLGLRTVLGLGLAMGIPLAGALFASSFAACVYWFYSDAMLLGKTGGGMDFFRLSDEMLGCQGLVYAITLTLLALVLLVAMLATP